MTNASQLQEHPRRLSSVYYKQLSLGAQYSQNSDGWMRAQNFINPNDESQTVTNGVGLADISHLAKLSVKGNRVVEGLKNLAPSTQVGPHAAFRISSTPFNDTLICVLTSDEMLILSKLSDSIQIGSHLERAEPERFHVTDLTSYFAGLYFIGPKSREVLSKLTEVNVNPDVFPDSSVSQVPIFHVRSILLRQDLRSVLGFQIYFDRGFGQYLWDKIMQAGKEFGIAPVGSSALKLLGWEWD
jgi:sarcosine oxidase subunit alpha